MVEFFELVGGLSLAVVGLVVKMFVLGFAASVAISVCLMFLKWFGWEVL